MSPLFAADDAADDAAVEQMSSLTNGPSSFYLVVRSYERRKTSFSG